MVIKSFKLGEYKGLNYDKPDIIVTDEEINSAIENIRTTYNELEDKEGIIEKDNHVYMNFEGKSEGKDLPGGKSSNYHLKIGQGLFIEDFEGNLYGLKKGDTKTFKVVFPQSYDNEELRGKKAEFKVEILNVKEEVHPVLNEEFIKKLQIDNVKEIEDLKDYVKNEIYYQKINGKSIDLINTLMREILDNVGVEFDDKAVEESVDEMVNDIKKQIKDGGMEMDVYYAYHNIKGEPALRELFSEEVKTSHLEIRTLEEIAKLENVSISDEEYIKVKEAYLKQQNVSEDVITDEAEFKKSIIFKKVVNYLVEINTK